MGENAHLVVGRGYVSAEGHDDLVVTNNPWGAVNIQTYDDFMAGIPGDDTGMKVYGALRVS